MDEDVIKIILISCVILLLSVMMSQCMVRTEEINSNERIEMEKIQNRPAYILNEWEWYDGCVAGCNLAGKRVLDNDGVGINNFLLPRCSEYCVDELKNTKVT